MLSLELHTATFKMKSLISRVFVALLLCVALAARQTHVCAQDAPIDAVNNTTPVIDNDIGVIPAEAVPVNEDVPVDGADEDSELELDPIPEDGDVPSTVQAGDVTDPVDTQNDMNDVVVDVVNDDADNLDDQEVDVDIPDNEADIFADQDLDPDFDANLNDEFFDEDVGDVTEVVDEIELDTVNDNGTTIVDAITFADLEAGVARIVFAYHLPPGVTEEAALANLPVLLLEILPVDDVEIVLKIVDEYYLGVFEVLAGEADFTESSSEAIISNHDELETIVVETYANGKHYHEILALTHEDSNIQSFGQLEGKRACFSKFDDNAGMKLPIGYYLRTNQMPAGSDLEDTITSFFSNGSCAEPVLCETCKDNNVNGNCNDLDLYAGYQGAMECLIEKAGEVAFIRDIDIDVPDDEAMADHIRPFVTIPMDGVRLPSHTVVIKKPGANRRQANATRAELIRDHLRSAFLSITADDPISQYLHSNHGYTTMGMDSQLSGFEENIACVPGLSLGLQCRTEADNSVAGNSSTPANGR
ncbi:hypothetical protein SARC_01956 [Sphaeroforma arctica JP610]|uniref:Transferrin-like domain-containing protein n=1 Tax=Sphaeroforma arctica JP610 TaxID=667725 RepID=A0A0L0GA53_9EUKA|nr:hypothetical protein SARC_01956 [Sphaeroforma arctica JP610]KNC85880.1 hypothetical protein SARC_01956 [Sphaeroforma arctica JP610]|eukprot:XP_014159782.1 hypothetical protein SARC_01956 [Sphaeroforma arctica JP610]